MLYKARGLVLNHIKFKESSIICKIFTDRFGLQSYIINGVRSSKSKNKISLYQPLTLLDLVVYQNKKKEIQRISEARLLTPYISLHQDLVKIPIAIFLTEILLHTSSDEEEQYKLFDFFKHSLIFFDSTSGTSTANFHFFFLINYLKHLGYISSSSQINEQHPIEISKKLKIIESIESISNTRLNKDEKRVLLDDIILFFREHIGLPYLKSLDIIRELF